MAIIQDTGTQPTTPTATPPTRNRVPATRQFPNQPGGRHRPPPRRGGGGGGGGGGTPPPDNPLTRPMTYEELQKQVADEVAAQISAENAPLQAQANTLTGQESTAQSELQAEQATLLPYIQSNAQAVDQANKDALSMEQSVFQAAGQRLNSLKQDAASEAQQLAQQIGGPVSTGEFTSTLDPYITAGAESGATNILHGLGISQANTQEAHQFAGQVFPAMMTEEQNRSRSYFEDQIKTLQDQMSQNAGAKSALIGQDLSDAIDKERTFELNLKSAALEKLKANRDWQATKLQLQHDSARLALSKKASAISESGVTGVYKGRPTLEAMKLSADEKLAAQRLGLSEAEYKARLSKYTVSTKAARAKDLNTGTTNAMSIIDSAMNPNGGKPITMTVKTYIKKGSPMAFRAESGKMGSGVHYDPQRKQWYTYQRVTQTPADWAKQGGYTGPVPISDPNRLYDLVRGSVPDLPKKVVVQLVRAKTGQQNWSPGQKTSYTGNELQGLTRDELVGLASDRGLRRIGSNYSRQQLVDYILHHHQVP